MSKRSLIIGAGMTAVGALALAGPASAADYPPPPQPIPTQAPAAPTVYNNNDLAKTGADNTITIAAVGGGLILVGGAAVFATRRRERSAR